MGPSSFALERTTSWVGRMLCMLALALVTSATWAAEVSDLSEDTRACLKCHDKPNLNKQLGDGKTLSLSISTHAFLTSRHFEQDCTDCHSKLEDDHGKPGVTSPLKNRRELQAAMQETCRDCHKKTQKLYDDSLHAALALKKGKDDAPLCANCHNAHTQTDVKIPMTVEKVPCASCHDKIYDAYKADVHGLERVKKGKEAPICGDCHKTHAVQAASLSEASKERCLGCHKEAEAQHKSWLPNAGLHFEAISCVACHAPDAKRRINLRLYDRASKELLRETASLPQFLERAKSRDTTGQGLSERDMFGVLTQFRGDRGPDSRVMLRGRLEVVDGVQAHQLAEKEKALKNCNTCHSDGAQPFRTVVLSIASADGRPLRHTVQPAVLNSLATLQSVRGFYAIGGTRIKLLDWLLLGAVSASVLGCLAHFTVLRISRARRAAAAAGTPRS